MHIIGIRNPLWKWLLICNLNYLMNRLLVDECIHGTNADQHGRLCLLKTLCVVICCNIFYEYCISVVECFRSILVSIFRRTKWNHAVTEWNVHIALPVYWYFKETKLGVNANICRVLLLGIFQLRLFSNTEAKEYGCNSIHNSLQQDQ